MLTVVVFSTSTEGFSGVNFNGEATGGLLGLEGLVGLEGFLGLGVTSSSSFLLHPMAKRPMANAIKEILKKLFIL
jgi:hypothetical protein